MLREQRNVFYALSQIGFVGIGSMDWIYRAGEVTCAIPIEDTDTFQQAIKFLREGAFQSALQKKTRLTYYSLAQQLESWCQLFHTKGTDGQPKERHGTASANAARRRQ
jgi:hypothetical protein